MEHVKNLNFGYVPLSMLAALQYPDVQFLAKLALRVMFHHDNPEKEKKRGDIHVPISINIL